MITSSNNKINEITVSTTIFNGLSESDLKLSFSNVFEQGINEESRFGFGKIYDSFFSIAVTILFTRLTAVISNEKTKYFDAALIFFFVIGIISLIVNSKRTKRIASKRDEVVTKEIEKIKSQTFFK